MRNRLSSILCLCVLLCLPLTQSSANSSDRAQFIQTREQGVLYWKKRRFKVAKRALLNALKMEGGKRDFKTLYFLALVHHELLQFGPTLTYIDLAITIKSGSTKRKAMLVGIKNEIEENYGFVKLRRAEQSGSEVGTFRIKALNTFLNKKKRRYVERIREFHETRPTRLPKRLYLPYGSYTISGMHVDLNQASNGSELEIFLDEFDDSMLAPPPPVSSQETNSKLWWVVGGVGATVAVGALTFFLLSESGASPGDEYRVSVGN